MHSAVPSQAPWRSQCRCLAVLLLTLTLVLVYPFGRPTRGGTKLWPHPLQSGNNRRTLVANRRSLPPGVDAKRPPQAPQVYADTPDTLNKRVTDFGEKEKSVVQHIIDSVKTEDATFQNTVLPYIHHEAEWDLALSVLGVYESLSPNEDLRTASRDLMSNLTDINQATMLNEEFFARVNTTYYKQVNDTELSTEDRLLLQRFWDQFEGAGLAQPKGKERDHYRNLAKELQVVSDEFNQALTEDDSALWFTREELNGTKENTLSTLEKGTGEFEGKLKLSLRSDPDVVAILTRCSNETTRLTVLTAYNERVPDNVARLKKAIVMRDEISRLNGAPNFAANTIEFNMAKTPNAVHELLDKVQERVKPAANRRIAHLEEIKKAETGDADPLYAWDFSYYLTLSYEREYNAHPEMVREYFPSEATMRAVLDLYAELYHLNFVKVEGKDLDELSATGKGEDLLYHPDVELYAVWNDAASLKHRKRSDGDFLGYLYLDLFQRPGKRGSAYMVPIEQGFALEDGNRHFPACAMVTNYKESDSDIPSLLFRGEVQDVFHELGHAVHHLTSRVTYSRFHGPNGCPLDFAELPSQLMENWAQEAQVLKRVSKHWSYLSDNSKAAWKKQQNTSEAVQPPEQMPDDMIATIQNVRNTYSSNDELQQVFLATFDLRVHEPATHEDAEKIDTTALYYQLYENITGITEPKASGQGYKRGHPEARNRHIMSGYEAAYYSYHWSRVFCKDLFYAMFKKDLFSTEQGGRLRKIVLEPGGTKDFYEMLTEFLGRAPNDQAYFDDLELDKY